MDRGQLTNVRDAIDRAQCAARANRHIAPACRTGSLLQSASPTAQAENTAVYEIITNTDPLALTALIGFATVIVVTIGLFAFILTRRGDRKNSRS